MREEIARAAAATKANSATFREAERQRVAAVEALRKELQALEAEETSARAKVSRAAQEVATTLLGQMIMGAQAVEMRATQSPVRLGAPRVAASGSGGWGDDDDDDGFEEVDMTPAPVRRPSTVQSSPWGGAAAAVGSGSPVSSLNRTPVALPRNMLAAHKKKTPPSTPLALHGDGGAAAATPTPVRRPGGMSLRKKSPPVRATPGTGTTAVNSFTPLSGARQGATPASTGASSGVRTLHTTTFSSPPSSSSKLPGHQVKMDDDDKWDDDW